MSRGGRHLVAAAAALAVGSTAAAHPKGFHERLTVTVARRSLTALLVLDVDGGERCSLLRAGADEDHDGALSEPERVALRARLVAMAQRGLTLAVSGYPLEPALKSSKLSLREDLRASDTGLSVAALLEVTFPKDVTAGMSLEVGATSPDGSAVVVEVFQAGGDAPSRLELEPGRKARIRLGALVPAPPAP